MAEIGVGLVEAPRFIAAAELHALGAELDIAELHEAIARAWMDIRSGIAFGGKAVMSLPEADFWASSGFGEFEGQFTGERLGWKLSALYSVNARYGGVKIIGANAFNRLRGLPRSASIFVLLDKFSLRPLAILEATAISAARTGIYASEVFNRCLDHRQAVSVFVFGAGPVARCVIDSLAHSAGARVEQVFVRSRTVEGAEALVHAIDGRTPFRLESVTDNRKLADCSFVITASNARGPVFEDHELNPAAVTLHLGGDEVPAACLQRVLRRGRVACDDIKTVSRRNSQSLALHFSRQGLSLEAVGPILGILELSAPGDWVLEPGEPVSITCVGLPMLDLYAVQAAYEKYLRLSGGRLSQADEICRQP